LRGEYYDDGMVQIASMGDQDNLLIGSIGTTDYDQIVYELDGETVTTDVSPAALVELCDIGQALIFRTPEAGEKNDHRLREAFSATNVDFELIDIGLIEKQEDVYVFTPRTISPLSRKLLLTSQ